MVCGSVIPSYFLFESFLNFIGIILEVGSSLLNSSIMIIIFSLIIALMLLN